MHVTMQIVQDIKCMVTMEFVHDHGRIFGRHVFV